MAGIPVPCSNPLRRTRRARLDEDEIVLPIVDLKNISGADTAALRAVADRIGAACEAIGFMYVCNHGIAQSTIDEALQATRSFFAQPVEYKRTLERAPGTYRGYIPMAAFSEDRDSGRAYLYEAFIIGPELEADATPGAGMRWPNVWPPGPTQLRRALTAYYRAVTDLSEHLLRAFGLALGGHEDTLLRHFGEPMTNISLLHYPRRGDQPGCEENGAGRGGDRQRGANARPHYDTNALTILLPGEAGGLEVEHRGLGWTEVPPRPGCFVDNIGNMMECWSAGRFRSTLHRVHPPIDRERFSIAYFASPEYETVIEPLPGVMGGKGEPRSRLHAGRAFSSFVAQFDRPGA